MKNDNRNDETIIYQGNVFYMIHTEVDIKGEKYPRDIIRHPGGVAILLIQDCKILFVRQMRHAINKETLEIPAGKMHYGEDPYDCAYRELNEETGYTCKELKLIQSIVTTPGFCDERIYIYEAVEPSISSHRLSMDEDEDIDTIWIDMDKAYQMIVNGEIDDAKTVCAVYYAIINRK